MSLSVTVDIKSLTIFLSSFLLPLHTRKVFSLELEVIPLMVTQKMGKREQRLRLQLDKVTN